MTTAERIDELVALLTRGTNEKSFRWQPTADENTFSLATSTGIIRLTRSEEYDQESGSEYTVRRLNILNDRGRVIEEYSAGAQQLRAFDDLFTLARHSAYGTNEILDKLLDEIKIKVHEKAS